MDDNILKMAREAGLAHFYDSEGDITGITDARLVDEDKHRNDERLVEILSPLIALVRADEREACAKVCEELPWKDMGHIPSNLAFAAAIRARGKA